MPVNLGNSLWARRMAMQQQQLAQQKAEMQHAATIAAEGSRDVNRIQQQAFQEGLRAAREAGQASASTGQPAPQYDNPQLQHAAQVGSLTMQGKLQSQQRKEQFDMYRQSLDHASREGIVYAQLGMQQRANKAKAEAAEARRKEDMNFRNADLELKRKKLALDAAGQKQDDAKMAMDVRAAETKELRDIVNMLTKGGKNLLAIPTEADFKRNMPGMYQILWPRIRYYQQKGLLPSSASEPVYGVPPSLLRPGLEPPPQAPAPAGAGGGSYLDALAAENARALRGL